MKRAIGLAMCVLGCAGAAQAAQVTVEITGTWDFGQLRSGPLAGINSGDVRAVFDVDSDNFIDSTNFPTRGYHIIQSSFLFTVNGINVGMPNPFPVGETPLFVIRNDDPAVDGFFLGSSVDGFPNGVSIDNAGLIDPFVKMVFSATYEQTRLPSLDILDAFGTYTFAGLSVFNWGFEDAGIQPAGLIFDQFTISPAPGALALLAPAGLIGLRRRR